MDALGVGQIGYAMLFRKKNTHAFDPVLTFSPEVTAFLTSEYQNASTVLEYGSGGSTALAARLGKSVIAVESDASWAQEMQAYLAATSPAANARVHPVDIGATRKWGFPVNQEKMAQFHHYALTVWDRPDFTKPDLVLIDGRFRVACFCTVALRIDRPTRVLFDDYANRAHYHKIEAIAKPTAQVGTMVAFDLVPALIAPQHLSWVIGSFVQPG